MYFFNMDEEDTKKTVKYQIKRFDDALFKMEISVNNNENNNLESLALERLGYFIVPEIEFE